MFFKNLPPLVRGLIYALAASFLLSIFLPSIALSALPLFPDLAIPHFQFWRLVTYAFYFIPPGGDIFNDAFRILWVGMILVFFGAELETIVHTKRLGYALAATILIGGILFCLISPDGVLMGAHLLTMFFLTGFCYLWPTRQISIFGFFTIKAWIIALVIFVVTIIPMSGFSLDTSASNLFEPLFGVIAALIFFHVTYQQYRFGRSILSRLTPTPGQRKQAAIDATDPRMIQRRIDAILDKITVSGMNSLSKEERDFLLRNSKS